MRIQCHCGTKYDFDIYPGMSREPVQFRCPACQTDLSPYLNDLIRRELGELEPAAVPAAMPVATAVGQILTPPAPQIAVPPPQPIVARMAPSPAVAAAPPAPPPALSVASKPRLSIGSSAPAAAAAAESAGGGQPGTCRKHPGQIAAEQCYVCQKPICPKCMEMFGYLCSPLCKATAERQGFQVPVYAGMRSKKEANKWRKIGLAIGAGAAVIALCMGTWFWYAFVGSMPSPKVAIRFPERAYFGSSFLSGQEKDQWVYLHGGTLARYDLDSGEQTWTVELIDTNQLNIAINKRWAEIQAEREQGIGLGRFNAGSLVISYEGLAQGMRSDAENELRLWVRGANVWIAKGEKITQYDWATGKPGKEVAIPRILGRPITRGDELLYVTQNEVGQNVVTAVNLISGESSTEHIGESLRTAGVAAKTLAANTPVADKKPAGGGLPTAGQDNSKPLEPDKVAAQAQRMSHPQKLALPATVANAAHQEQIMKELRDAAPRPGAPGAKPAPEVNQLPFIFMPSRNGYVQWSRVLLDAKTISRDAMRPPPAKSALDGNISSKDTAAVANEILNEMQRANGGNMETEDQSRYRVTVRKPNAKDVPDWTGDIIGTPSLHPLKSVNVVTGGRMIVVLDKSNKKMWQTETAFRLNERYFFEETEMNYPQSLGDGPIVEHGDTLYVYDTATLTAFDLATGNVRWRLPSIAIMGLFFDGEGHIYVNTSSADLASLKYTKEIDVTGSKKELVLKLEEKTGKVIWAAAGSYVSHVEGKFLYCFAMNINDADPDDPMQEPGKLPSLMVIRRLSPKNGKVMWDHVQERAPLHVRINGNMIEVVFRKEVQVLKYIAL